MLKNSILAIFAGVFVSAPVLAVTMRVEAISSFSTETPKETITVKLLKDCQLSETFMLSEGDVIYAKVVDVVSPKRLKRDATFSIVPETYTDKTGNTYNFDEKYTGKYSTGVDKKELAKNATLSVGNYFVKGLSLGVNAVEGAVKNKEGNRLKSSAKNVYENTPFSYVEAGEELKINPGDVFSFKFRGIHEEEDDSPDYEPPTLEE